jgi:transcriptional regulator with XRE-family HTH domain
MAIEKALLGKAIRKVRTLRGISQAALAEQAGLQSNFVALVERGQRGVSMETLNSLADALDMPAACLAILGTNKIAGGDGTALVKSMQKLIMATFTAQTKLEVQEAGRKKRKRNTRKTQHV